MLPRCYPYGDVWPTVDPSAWIAPGARLIGAVTLGAHAGIWFNVVVRGDVEPVTIGARTNIQDGTVIHVTRRGGPTLIGCDVTVGHAALLHACIIEDRAFIGMGAVVMDGAHIESDAMLAAGSLLTPDKRVPRGEIWGGRPACFMRLLTEEEIAHILVSSANYQRHTEEYRAMAETVPGVWG